MFPTNQLNILDQYFKPADNLQAFAYTNALLNTLPLINSPILHFWMLDQTLILGMKDQRLPNLTTDLQRLTTNHYHYFVRNSGGLAVISDQGVLNVSLFLPAKEQPLAVDNAYRQMTGLVQRAFPAIDIVAQEVQHSYCPGKFDLAVNSIKVGGMSQRRNQHGTVVMLYLSVNGNQQQRGQLVKDFYQAGLLNHENQWGFPDVWPESMTTLSQLVNHEITVNAAKLAITNALTETFSRQAVDLAPRLQTPEFGAHLNHELANMTRRQSKLPSLLS